MFCTYIQGDPLRPSFFNYYHSLGKIVLREKRKRKVNTIIYSVVIFIRNEQFHIPSVPIVTTIRVSRDTKRLILTR